MELVEVVDEDGTPTAVVSRAEMRASNLRHRSVGIVVRRPWDGAVLVHRRAAWKDVWPSYWDVAFGGVCGVGEDWADAAARELAEEAGVDVDPRALVHVADGTYDDERVSVVGRLFEVRHDGPFTFPDGEVEAVEWVPFADVLAWAAERDICPDSLALAQQAWLPPGSGPSPPRPRADTWDQKR